MGDLFSTQDVPIIQELPIGVIVLRLVPYNARAFEEPGAVQHSSHDTTIKPRMGRTRPVPESQKGSRAILARQSWEEDLDRHARTSMHVTAHAPRPDSHVGLSGSRRPKAGTVALG